MTNPLPSSPRDQRKTGADHSHLLASGAIWNLRFEISDLKWGGGQGDLRFEMGGRGGNNLKFEI